MLATQALIIVHSIYIGQLVWVYAASLTGADAHASRGGAPV